MQPSSLVFVVVIAVWAAYVAQYWLKRRDQLATARTHDRFSRTMRVLDLRGSSAALAPAGGHAGAHALRMAQVRGEVGELGADPPPVHPAQAGPGTSEDAGGAASATAESVPVTHLTPPRGASAKARPARPDSATPQPAPSRTAEAPAPRTHPVRGLVFLVTVVAVPATAGLMALGLLPWVTPVVALVAMGAALVWVRRGVVRARRSAAPAQGPHRVVTVPEARAGAPRRPAERPAERRHSERRHAERGLDVGEAAPMETGSVPAEPRRKAAGATREPEAAEPERTREATAPAAEAPFDIRALEESLAPVVDPEPVEAPAPAAGAWPELDEDDMPLTWNPVPVPRPTYAMKARAYYPEPLPSPYAPRDEEATAETRGTAYDGDGEDRRVVGG